MLLIHGMSEWEERQTRMLKEEEESQSVTEQPAKKKDRPDFSKMSGADYMRYCDTMRL